MWLVFPVNSLMKRQVVFRPTSTATAFTNKRLIQNGMFHFFMVPYITEASKALLTVQARVGGGLFSVIFYVLIKLCFIAANMATQYTVVLVRTTGHFTSTCRSLY